MLLSGLCFSPLLLASGSSASQTASAPAAETPIYECRWTDQPITIDGKADEPAWRQAQTIDRFEITWLPGGPRKPHTATKAKLLWDRDYLYFFAEMEDHDLFAPITEHQGMVWTNDCFELFFKPTDQKPAYYEFEVSPANTTLELFFPSRDSGGYDRYKHTTHIELKTAVKLRGTLNNPKDRDDGWSVEGRIPWRDFARTGGPPKSGDVWKFILCRVDFTTGVEKPDLSTCAPLTQSNFHRYEDYARLKFVGKPKG